MNSKLLLTIFLGLFFPLLISAQIKFETTVFDYGQITQGGEIIKDIKFTNTGKEPLIIQRASTGDGGSFADYPKEPILPGKTGTIDFHYDSNRIGRFSKVISVNYVSGNSYEKNINLTVKGEVVFRKTNISLDDSIKNIGDLRYGDVDTIEFTLRNSGEYPLHILFDSYNYPECDMLSSRIDSKERVNPTTSGDMFLPNERIRFRFVMRNIYGNTGKFERKLFIHFNSHDSLLLKITGNFIGMPEREKVVEGGENGSSVFYYQDGKLVKKDDYDRSGNLYSQEFYEGTYCVHKIKCMWGYTNGSEYFYKDGIIISKQYFKQDH